MTKRRPPRRVVDASWYDYPAYYDVAMMDDTQAEADFVEAVWKKFGSGPLRTTLEPGCGSGRLVRELAKRGFGLAAFDDNEKAIAYLRARLTEEGTTAELFRGNLSRFRVSAPVDLAHCFCNTFRHLLTPEHALSHLRSVARALRPGGLYVLGLHIMPIDADPVDSERWTCERDGVKVRTTLTVARTFPRKRLERLRVVMDVDAPNERIRIQSWTTLRLWNLVEILALLKRVRAFSLVGTYDFLYDVDDPVALDEYSSDVVFVLRKK